MPCHALLLLQGSEVKHGSESCVNKSFVNILFNLTGRGPQHNSSRFIFSRWCRFVTRLGGGVGLGWGAISLATVRAHQPRRRSDHVTL